MIQQQHHMFEPRSDQTHMKSVLLTSSRTKVLSVVYVNVYVKRYDLNQLENEDTVFWCLNVIRANNCAFTESHYIFYVELKLCSNLLIYCFNAIHLLCGTLILTG